MSNDFNTCFTAEQLALLDSLDSPPRIQGYLDSIPYSPEDANRSPASVLRDRQAHCLDGALFAAAALCRHGYAPLVLDMLPEAGTDDDHMLAVFRVDGYLGAIAKSNYVGLRYREPVYRNVRELVVSYFEDFYNVNGVKTMRSYTRPVNLRAFDRTNWYNNDDAPDEIMAHIDRLRHYVLITPPMAARLSYKDERGYNAGMMGSDPNGLYVPKR